MKKKMVLLSCLTALSIGFSGCGNGDSQTTASAPQQNQQPAVSDEEAKQKAGEDAKKKEAEILATKKASEEKAKQEAVAKKAEQQATSKTSLTKDEFDRMFKQDPEEKQYPNGKFQLKDGSIVKADYLMYGKNDLFSYAMAIFYKGKLAKIQIETDATQEKIIQSLGIPSTEEVKIEPNKFGYEIIFDETFHDSNIAVFPNEWD